VVIVRGLSGFCWAGGGRPAEAREIRPYLISGTTIIITKVKAAQHGDLILFLDPQQHTMGILATVTDAVSAHLGDKPLWLAVSIVAGATFALAIVLNVLSQLLPVRRKGSEPPLVFHWVPFIGSTITYGIDPYKFFFNCREQVRCCLSQVLPQASPTDSLNRSTAMSSPSSCSARRRLSASAPRATTSS
jgi:hypothetical protein